MPLTTGPPASLDSWELRLRMPWWLRMLAVIGLLALFAFSVAAEVAVAVVWYATLGAATGWWSGPRSFVLAATTAGRYGAVLFATVWLALWTGPTIWAGGWLWQMLRASPDVIQLRAGELRVRRRFPRDSVRVAVEDIGGVYLLAGQGDLMVRTPAGRVEVSGLGTGAERAALAGVLRGVLGRPAEATWRPALPAGFTSEPGPEGVIVGPAGEGQTVWLVAPEMVSVREIRPEAEPKVTFAGRAVELITVPDEEDKDELACQLVLLGEPAVVSGRPRYVLLTSGNDPTTPRELGLWLAASADIPFDDQITE